MSNVNRLQVLYDGRCPICRGAVGRLKQRDRTDRLQLIDVSVPAFDPSRYGLSRDAVMARMHAVEPDGTVHAGMDAVHVIHRAVGRGWLTALTRRPGLRALFDRLYDWLARHRPRAANACDRHCKFGEHGR